MILKKIKLAYIGGGSKAWARVFMNDLALTADLTGEIALYDIDKDSAIRNQKIGLRINEQPETLSKWNYVVADSVEEALTGADFVAISILPGTLTEMASDVHTPEKYGIFQAVGDTVGPGGVLRAMRTVPIYEGFAKAIRQYCPDAWVINLTNPMTICCKTLYEVFPKIKAFGCCHEVFHAEEFLCCVLKEILGIQRPSRKELVIDASGINHFTWITEAKYGTTDVMALLPVFCARFYESGYCEREGDPQAFRGPDPFLYGNKVKMDLYRRFGALGAAGDRHLVEFLNNSWYLKDQSDPERWLYHLTEVEYRMDDQKRKIAESEAIAAGKMPATPKKSDEDLIDLMKAILGLGPVISNVNLPNRGQMSQIPNGAVVETNCVFDADSVRPISANPLPGEVAALVRRNSDNFDNLYSAIHERDLRRVFEVFMNQPLCSTLSVSDGKQLFREMCSSTEKYLKDFYGLRI